MKKALLAFAFLGFVAQSQAVTVQASAAPQAAQMVGGRPYCVVGTPIFYNTTTYFTYTTWEPGPLGLALRQRTHTIALPGNAYYCVQQVVVQPPVVIQPPPVVIRPPVIVQPPVVVPGPIVWGF